ncbi:uncharacterized protein N7483_010409 [Penicillium malachiteum]|uniref:uncharacterized protein n=1 Tax=Penicillium malachiteum TaxID=1324776 RepID=UPI0025495BC4|nr:uncharacterized protein N7483_010409 [Penicillium malachiteum]KAJ5713228.1 hypothetical protein N7483_010409 [Penicillium malachiteum]
MEAVNRVVNAASSALWGEDYTHPKDIPHGDEPISGVQGKGLANDPYDAGNREEQPGAPSSDEGNTAPQEPKLEGNPLNSTVTESSNPSKPDAGFALAGGSGSGSVYSESPKTSKAGALEQRTNTEPGPAHSSPAHVSPAAEPTSPSTTSPSTSKKEAAEHNINEDESAFEEENNGQENDTPMQSSSHPEDPHTHASKEALEGPQGPAPRSAEEFEKEMKEKKMPSRPKNPESPIAAATTSTGSSKSEFYLSSFSEWFR